MDTSRQAPNETLTKPVEAEAKPVRRVVPLPIYPRGAAVPFHVARYDERLSKRAQNQPRYFGPVVERYRLPAR